MQNPFDFSGKKIVIVGAGNGIGKETALLLSKQGAILSLLDKDLDALQEVIGQMKNQNHNIYEFDASDHSKIESLIHSMVIEQGAFDGFIYCVGIRSRRPLSLLTPQLFIDVLNTNVVAFLEFTRCLVKKNNYNKGFSIVSISSIAAQRGSAGVTAYAASKAAIESITRCLGLELSGRNIRINTVVPSQINTPAYGELMELSGKSKDPVLDRQYLGLGQPEQVADVIAFLLSEASSFITGSSIPVDGGYLSS